MLQVEAAGGVKKYLFDWGYARKLHHLQQGYSHDKVGNGSAVVECSKPINDGMNKLKIIDGCKARRG